MPARYAGRIEIFFVLTNILSVPRFSRFQAQTSPLSQTNIIPVKQTAPKTKTTKQYPLIVSSPRLSQTEEEMYSYTGANFTESIPDDVPEYVAPLTAGPASGARDWRTANGGKAQAVTKIKNQGRCGSCWVFSAVGALEGAYKNKGSILKSFSEQEGLECSMRNGCGGGWMHYVYNYAKKAGRFAEMKDVPYKGWYT